MNDNEERKKLQNLIRKTIEEELVNEEIEPSEKRELEDKVCSEIKDQVEKVLLDFDIHKKGFSEQQASNLFRKVIFSINEVIQEFTSVKRPEKFKNYQRYIEKYNL